MNNLQKPLTLAAIGGFSIGLIALGKTGADDVAVLVIIFFGYLFLG